LHEAYQLKKEKGGKPETTQRGVFFSKKQLLPRPALHGMLKNNSLEMMNPLVALVT